MLYIYIHRGGFCMKRFFISLLAAIFISIIIPLIIVELARPDENASSTEPQPTAVAESV